MPAGISLDELRLALEGRYQALISLRDNDLLTPEQFGTFAPVVGRLIALCDHAKAARPFVRNRQLDYPSYHLDEIYSITTTGLGGGDATVIGRAAVLLNRHTQQWGQALLDQIGSLGVPEAAIDTHASVVEGVSNALNEAAEWQGHRDFESWQRGDPRLPPLAVTAEFHLHIEVAAGNLLELLGSLIAERDELERLLATALDDAESAARTIEVLLAQNGALRAAHATGDPETRSKLLTWVARGLVPLLGFVAGHTTAAVQGEYDVTVARIEAQADESIAEHHDATAIRVARIAADAEIRAAEIATAGQAVP